MSTPVRITVNGAAREFGSPPTFEELLATLSLGGKRVALERNGQVVPRSRFGQECVADGDRIEVVVAVGGG